MFTLKLSAVLDRKTPEISSHDAYVIRDGDTVFYVGMTGKGIVHRMWAHLGWSNHTSTLGKLIYANLPESREWSIQLFSKEECKCRTAKRTETHLIQSLKPILNIRENSGGYELPCRYKPPMSVGYQDSPSDLIVIGKS